MIAQQKHWLFILFMETTIFSLKEIEDTLVPNTWVENIKCLLHCLKKVIYMETREEMDG